MIRENKLLEFLKSNAFILYVAIFTVIFQAPNTYYVYHSFSVFASPYREIASAGVAVIVSASIMIYTLRKNFFVAKCYSVFEVGIASYYYIDTIGWHWGLLPAFGIALIIPISVYYYTNEINKEEVVSQASGKEIDALKRDYEEIIEQWRYTSTLDVEKIKSLQSEVSKANDIIDRDAETIAMLTAEVEAQRTVNTISNVNTVVYIKPTETEEVIDEVFTELKSDEQPATFEKVKATAESVEALNKTYNVDLKKKSTKSEKEQGFWNSKENGYF